MLFDLLPRRVSAVIFVGNQPLVVGFVLRHRGTMMKRSRSPLVPSCSPARTAPRRCGRFSGSVCEIPLLRSSSTPATLPGSSEQPLPHPLDPPHRPAAHLPSPGVSSHNQHDDCRAAAPPAPAATLPRPAYRPIPVRRSIDTFPSAIPHSVTGNSPGPAHFLPYLPIFLRPGALGVQQCL